MVGKRFGFRPIWFCSQVYHLTANGLEQVTLPL